MKPKYSKEQVEEAVASSYSWADVCNKLMGQHLSGSRAHMKKRSDNLGIDYSHFSSAHWRRGGCKPAPLEDFLSNKLPCTSHTLKMKLFKAGIKEQRCEKCGASEWCGELLPLDLDHIDRNHFNNALENLMILCPNCHAIKTRKQRAAARKPRPPKTSVKCGGCDKRVNLRNKSGLCRDCMVRPTKIEWPDLVTLKAMVSSGNYAKVGRELGVSDQAIRNHIEVREK